MFRFWYCFVFVWLIQKLFSLYVFIYLSVWVTTSLFEYSWFIFIFLWFGDNTQSWRWTWCWGWAGSWARGTRPLHLVWLQGISHLHCDSIVDGCWSVEMVEAVILYFILRKDFSRSVSSWSGEITKMTNFAGKWISFSLIITMILTLMSILQSDQTTHQVSKFLMSLSIGTFHERPCYSSNLQCCNENPENFTWTNICWILRKHRFFAPCIKLHLSI